MGDLSKDFSRWEFACRCGCGFKDVKHELVVVMQDIRDNFGRVDITSGCRCADHNRDVGGAVHSRHLLGVACDFITEDGTPEQVQDYLDAKYPDTYGLGRYKSFTHIDTRLGKARW